MVRVKQGLKVYWISLSARLPGVTMEVADYILPFPSKAVALRQAKAKCFLDYPAGDGFTEHACDVDDITENILSCLEVV
jgi:hypothetical protein